MYTFVGKQPRPNYTTTHFSKPPHLLWGLVGENDGRASFFFAGVVGKRAGEIPAGDREGRVSGTHGCPDGHVLLSLTAGRPGGKPVDQEQGTRNPRHSGWVPSSGNNVVVFLFLFFFYNRSCFISSSFFFSSKNILRYSAF